MREVILVGASWCGECKAMLDWFGDLTAPGVALRYVDIEDADVAHEISSLPTVLFMESQETLQNVSGAMSRNDLEHTIKSLWEEYDTDMPSIPYTPAYENFIQDEHVSA